MTDETITDAGDALPPDLAAEAQLLLAETDPILATDAPADDAGVDTGAMLSGLLEITFNNLIAPRRGDHWLMNSDECQALGNAYGAVLDKYLPGFDGGVEFSAILVTFAVIGPRVAQDARAKSSDTDAEPAADAVPAGDGVSTADDVPGSAVFSSE